MYRNDRYIHRLTSNVMALNRSLGTQAIDWAECDSDEFAGFFSTSVGACALLEINVLRRSPIKWSSGWKSLGQLLVSHILTDKNVYYVSATKVCRSFLASNCAQIAKRITEQIGIIGFSSVHTLYMLHKLKSSTRSLKRITDSRHPASSSSWPWVFTSIERHSLPPVFLAFVFPFHIAPRLSLFVLVYSVFSLQNFVMLFYGMPCVTLIITFSGYIFCRFVVDFDW